MAAVTPLGQLPFFTEFLRLGGRFDAWVDSCPLVLTSPNAPSNRDVLGSAVLAVLSGHQRYAVGIVRARPVGQRIGDVEHAQRGEVLEQIGQRIAGLQDLKVGAALVTHAAVVRVDEIELTWVRGHLEA